MQVSDKETTKITWLILAFMTFSIVWDSAVSQMTLCTSMVADHLQLIQMFARYFVPYA